MNTSEILTERADLESAQEICKIIDNEDVRNRSVANVFAANIASKFFDEDQYNIDKESGLHNIPQILERLDISDIYINNSYIDVRLAFQNDNLAIPLSHIEKDFLPIAYMFIKISEDLSEAEVLGFVLPEDIEKDRVVDGNIIISEDILKSFYDVEPYMVYNQDTIDIDDSEIYALFENSTQDNIQLYKKLVCSKDARIRLAKIAKAQYIFNFVSISKSDNVEENEKTSITDSSLLDTVDIENLELNTSDDNENDLLLLESDNETDSIILEESPELNRLDDNEDDHLLLESDNETDSVILEESSELSSFDDNENELLLLESDNETDTINLEESPELNSLETSVEESDTNLLFEDTTLDELENIEEVNSLEDNEDITEEKNEPVENEFNLDLQDEYPAGTGNELGSNLETLDMADKEPEDNIQTESSNDLVDSNFEFKTNTTPSLELDTDLEKALNSPEVEENISDDFNINNTTSENKERNTTYSSENEENEENNIEQKEEQLDSLFTDSAENENINNDETAVEEFKKPKKNSSKIVSIFGLIAIIAALSYLGYTKLIGQNELEETPKENNIVSTANNTSNTNVVKEAMPIESVEKTIETKPNNEGNAISVPAIEQNLDASILVSNLKVEWEVPAGYITNNSAKRYLVKLGKIVQLNLKTELLLLNKPPITNKIAVEIKFNKDTKKFEAVGITISSGEQSIDDLILKTVNNALALNLSLNSALFSKLQGNPILVIHL